MTKEKNPALNVLILRFFLFFLVFSWLVSIPLKLGTLRQVALHQWTDGGAPCPSLKRNIHGIFYALDEGCFSCLHLLEEACVHRAEVEWIFIPVQLRACLHQAGRLENYCLHLAGRHENLLHAVANIWPCVLVLFVAENLLQACVHWPLVDISCTWRLCFHSPRLDSRWSCLVLGWSCRGAHNWYQWWHKCKQRWKDPELSECH